MKTLTIFAALLLSIGIFGQTKQWNEVYTITSAKNHQVYWPGATGDISGYSWSVTFRTIGLSSGAPIYISLGGSNDTITGYYNNPLTMAFVPFNTTDFPYTFNPAKDTARTNGVLRYEHNFRSPEPYGYMRPSFELTTTTDVAFILITNWVFSK